MFYSITNTDEEEGDLDSTTGAGPGAGPAVEGAGAVDINTRGGIHLLLAVALVFFVVPSFLAFKLL